MAFTPCARPGCIAPHAWLDDGRSLYDTFGAGFTLLVAGSPDDSDSALLELATRAAAEANVPLTISAPDHKGLDELYEARFALIRPDQHVAWRGETWPDDGVNLFKRVSGQ
jgi:hypothetical protein